jgi:hypothetical protein
MSSVLRIAAVVTVCMLAYISDSSYGSHSLEMRGERDRELDSAGALGNRSIGFAPSLAISQWLNMVAKISLLRSRWGMNRIGAAATRADKLRAMSVIAGELEPLPIHESLFQTNAHQSHGCGECRRARGTRLRSFGGSRRDDARDVRNALLTVGKADVHDRARCRLPRSIETDGDSYLLDA